MVSRWSQQNESLCLPESYSAGQYLQWYFTLRPRIHRIHQQNDVFVRLFIRLYLFKYLNATKCFLYDNAPAAARVHESRVVSKYTAPLNMEPCLELCVSAQCAAICNVLWLATTRYSPYDASSNIANTRCCRAGAHAAVLPCAFPSCTSLITVIENLLCIVK
jgi:hypothetical protein